MESQAHPAARARVDVCCGEPGQKLPKKPPALVRDNVTSLESESGTNFISFPGLAESGRDTVCLNLPCNSNCSVQIHGSKVQVKGASALLPRAVYSIRY